MYPDRLLRCSVSWGKDVILAALCKCARVGCKVDVSAGRLAVCVQMMHDERGILRRSATPRRACCTLHAMSGVTSISGDVCVHMVVNAPEGHRLPIACHQASMFLSPAAS